MDKLSYAIGLNIANNLKVSGFANISVDDFAEAVKAVYAGESAKMTDAEAKSVIQDYFEKAEKEKLAKNLEEGKKFFSHKYPDMKFLAYFQAYTNTYESIDKLKSIYEEALGVEDVIGIVIGTRPDCVSDELLDYLGHLNTQTFITIEYGIETANNNTLKLITRGHDFECVKRIVSKTAEKGIITGGHIILGLPGEDSEEIIRQAPLISALPINILKMHQLQVIHNTRLAQMFKEHPFHLFSPDEYIELIGRYIKLLRKDIVIERFTSQSPKDMLIGPQWGMKNHEFTNKLIKHLRENNIYQGQDIILP